MRLPPPPTHPGSTTEDYITREVAPGTTPVFFVFPLGNKTPSTKKNIAASNPSNTQSEFGSSGDVKQKKVCSACGRTCVLKSTDSKFHQHGLFPQIEILPTEATKKWRIP